MIAAVQRLIDRTLFRPGPSLMLFGGVTLASNWVWYGSGLFLGRVVGAVLTVVGALTWILALFALRRGRGQTAALAVFIVGSVALPGLALTILRWRTGAPILFHDGAYQTEEAMRLALGGHDPYGTDYTQTSMSLWHWYVNQPLDPALFHYVYYPLTFLVAVPFNALAAVAHVPFDFRAVLLIAAVAAGVGLAALPWKWEWRYVAMVALFLDPFFFLPQGRNDILFIAAIIAGVLAWSRERPVLAALGFGIALAFKQFSVFYIAPLALALLAMRSRGQLTTRTLVGAAIGVVIPIAVTVLPFFIWNPSAFSTDTVGVVTGTAPHSFPIRGLGISALMVTLHLLPGPNAWFPFGFLQAGIAIAILAAGLPRVWREPTTSSILTVGGWTTAGVLVASRYLNDSHVAVLLFLLVLAGAARRAALDRQGRHRSDPVSPPSAAAAA